MNELLTPEERTSHWVEGSGYIHNGHYDMEGFSWIKKQVVNY